jgi:putative transposase
VLDYLARYTHRAAISNHRLVDVTETQVSFHWKDYAHHSKRRIMTLTHEEFLRRFLQHILPRGFPRIRYFGWFANRRRGAGNTNGAADPLALSLLSGDHASR